jgi:hypothetical protein
MISSKEFFFFPMLRIHEILVRIRMIEGFGSVSLTNQWIRIWIREAQKHMDHTDPDSDPQHCLFLDIGTGNA